VDLLDLLHHLRLSNGTTKGERSGKGFLFLYDFLTGSKNAFLDEQCVNKEFVQAALSTFQHADSDPLCLLLEAFVSMPQVLEALPDTDTLREEAGDTRGIGPNTLASLCRHIESILDNHHGQLEQLSVNRRDLDGSTSQSLLAIPWGPQSPSYSSRQFLTAEICDHDLANLRISATFAEDCSIPLDLRMNESDLAAFSAEPLCALGMGLQYYVTDSDLSESSSVDLVESKSLDELPVLQDCFIEDSSETCRQLISRLQEDWAAFRQQNVNRKKVRLNCFGDFDDSLGKLRSKSHEILSTLRQELSELKLSDGRILLQASKYLETIGATKRDERAGNLLRENSALSLAILSY